MLYQRKKQENELEPAREIEVSDTEAEDLCEILADTTTELNLVGDSEPEPKF